MKTKIIVLLLLGFNTYTALAQEAILGEIRLMAGEYAPRGWAKCNGQLLPINTNQALFSILGTTYGGNGQTTFALPDLRGRAVVGAGVNSIQGTTGGNLTITLNNTNIAHAHNEVVKVSNAAATSQTPVNGNALGVANININGQTYPVLGYNNAVPTLEVSRTNTTAAGTTNPQSISVVQPIITLNYMISLFGTYPSQN